jgi:hypothetical protein
MKVFSIVYGLNYVQLLLMLRPCHGLPGAHLHPTWEKHSEEQYICWVSGAQLAQLLLLRKLLCRLGSFKVRECSPVLYQCCCTPLQANTYSATLHTSTDLAPNLLLLLLLLFIVPQTTR